MNKMGAMPIYGKKVQNFLLHKYSPMIMKLDLEHYVLKLYKVYINDEPELTLTYFTTILNLAKLFFILIKTEQN